jgi:hypothetical protein
MTSKVHKVVTQHCSGPLEGCHKALVLDPFNGKANCIAGGGNYQCCKIPSDLQGTELIEMTTQFTVDIADTSGNILFEVVPSMANPIRLLGVNAARGSGNVINFGNATNFNGGTTPYVGLGSAGAVFASCVASRVVAFGLVVEPNLQLMNQSGTLAMANYPPDPYHRLVSNAGITSINDIKQQPGAVSARNVKGIHGAWVPHDKCNYLYQSSNGVYAIGSQQYEDWLITAANGINNYFDQGFVLGNTASSLLIVYPEDTLSRLIVAASGMATAATTGILTCYLTMHVEVIPLNLNRPISNGRLGLIPRTNTGAPGDKPTPNSVASVHSLGSELAPIGKFLWSNATKGAGAAVSGLAGAATKSAVMSTLGYAGGLAADGAEMLGGAALGLLI